VTIGGFPTATASIIYLAAVSHVHGGNRIFARIAVYSDATVQIRSHGARQGKW